MGVLSRKMLATLVATITGLGSATIGASVITYEAMFKRVERPDYTVTAGIRCAERSALTNKKLYTFKVDKINHQGYYYPSQSAKGLIVFCHGLKSGADDYLNVYEYFVQNGFSVFAFDSTGVYDSEGYDMVGMCQFLVAMDGALKFVKSQKELNGLPLFVAGHSLGGHAAASVLELHQDVLGAGLIAPVNNAYTLILDKGEEMAGKIALFPKPFINTYQKLLFGKYTNFNSVRGINSSNAKIFIAHGKNDLTISFDKLSVLAKKNQIKNPSVTYYVTEGEQGGHQSLIHSQDAINYQKEIDNKQELIKKGNDYSLDKEQEFINGVDHTLYSKINQELFQKMLETFNSCL